MTLSYLARGFDWAADYTRDPSADGATMDLGAWVTLANGNGVGFPPARTQVVAGRVNRESGEVEPIDAGGPILARCWPRGSTSDLPELLQIDRRPRRAAANSRRARPWHRWRWRRRSLADMMQAAQRVEQEQLGDLKLYRVPDRTTVAARQVETGAPAGSGGDSDQDRLRRGSGGEEPEAARRGARAGIKTAADHERRGQSSRIAAAVRERRGICRHRGERLLERESGIRDLAVDEELEIDLGASPDVAGEA